MRNAGDWRFRHLLERIHCGTCSDQCPDPLTAANGAFTPDSRNRFCTAVGASPDQYLKTVQLHFAKMLLSDTALSLPHIAVACGFASPERAVDALANLYHRDPLTFRKPLPVRRHEGMQSCALLLAYRPPFDWPALLDYFRRRAIAGVESVDGSAYRRSFCLNGQPGWLSVQHAPDRHAVRLEVHCATLELLMPIVWRVRRMFDLDADPLALESLFRSDRRLGRPWVRHNGVRVPVAWDAFEFAVRAIVGQVVSVAAATTLMGRIADTFSEELALPAPKGIEKVFPGPTGLQNVQMRTLGLTRSKVKAIAAISRAIIDGALDPQTTANLDHFVQRCTALPGIGDWTAQTIAMRGMGHPDAFPAGDLGIVKALSAGGRALKPAQIRQLAERWRPWRSYAAMLLWMM
jgi:AraC family transcriptional regulator of adaptative response / DNA-3-methyladenine glycosylase II